nr:hypothetical protein [Tanacetum cinerariifolium]
MTLFNGICDNCIYGAGMPIICTTCGGIVRGGLCLPCDLREKNLYNFDPNAYSFNNFNYFPQPQNENYLCNLCGNNSHDDYDCQQQFSFVYKQEPSYNQNYDDNYYPHESLSFPCCDYCGGSHETFQCQPDNQNDEFSGSDQIQTPQFNCIPLEEKPQILFQTWKTFFAIQCSQPEDSNKLFQKLLKDLKELAEYDQSTSTDHPFFLNGNEGHSVQDKESLENPFNEIAVSKPDNESGLEPEVTTNTELFSTKDIQPLPDREPPQNSNIRQLIREECCVEIPEQQKQKMEDTMFELVKICQEKEFLCIHDDVDDLIESALDSKLLLINSNSQRLDKKEREVKNVVEQPAGKDEIECDIPANDNCSPVFTTFSNPLFKDNDDLDSSNDESLPDEDVPVEEFKVYSNPLFDENEINSDKSDPHYFNVESDFDFEEEIRLIENLLYDNSFPRPPEELNAEIADTIIESIPLLPIPVQDDNSQKVEIDIVTETDDVLLPSDDNDDDLSNDFLLGEADLFFFDNSIPSGIENVADDPEGDICFLEELLIDDSILSHESFDSSFEDNLSILRPPPKPPDAETDAGEEIAVVMIGKNKSDDDS